MVQLLGTIWSLVPFSRTLHKRRTGTSRATSVLVPIVLLTVLSCLLSLRYSVLHNGNSTEQKKTFLQPAIESRESCLWPTATLQSHLKRPTPTGTQPSLIQNQMLQESGEIEPQWDFRDPGEEGDFAVDASGFKRWQRPWNKTSSHVFPMLYPSSRPTKDWAVRVQTVSRPVCRVENRQLSGECVGEFHSTRCDNDCLGVVKVNYVAKAIW